MPTAEQIANALKPPRCPWCEVIVTRLLVSAASSSTTYAELSDNEEELEYDYWEHGDVYDEEFCCPNCTHIITLYHAEAKRFLQGHDLEEFNANRTKYREIGNCYPE